MLKRKKSKLLLAMALTLTMGASIVGCSNKGPEPTQPASTDKKEKIVVTVAAGAVGQELELTKEAAKMYSDKNPDVEVKVLDTPDLAQDRLGLYLQFLEKKSAEVDVYQVDVVWPGDLAEHFVDLYEFGAKDVVGDHFEAIVENNTVNGKLVAIPWFTDAGLLYYRKDLLDKYKLEVPKTWTDLEKASKVIQDGERKEGNKDFWGYVWQGNSYEGLTCDALEWVASNGGGDIVSKDKKITINNANAIEIVKKAAGWVGTISPKGVTAMGEEDARGIWQSGNAAFMRNWPYCYALSNGDDSKVKDKFGVAPLPKGEKGEKGGATLGGWQLAVSKYSKNQKAAADVALFFASKDVQKMRAVKGSMNPTIKSLYKDEEVLKASPFFGDLYDVFTNAVARPSTATAPNYNQVSTKFFTAVHNVLMGKETAEKAFENLEADLEEITKYEVAKP